MNEVARAAAALRAGGLVAFPTETVYGLGADASNPDAVARVFAAKGRPADHPLIVHLPDLSMVSRWAIEVPESALKLAETMWPGPLTLILKRHPAVLDAVTGGQETVGLRVPRHPVALALLKAFGGGIAAPSANRFGHVSPTTAAHVRDEFGSALDMVLDGGPCEVGIESTILDFSSGKPRILRPGMLDARILAAQWCDPQGATPAADVPRVSGSLESHYAPATPMTLVTPDNLLGDVHRLLGQGRKVAVLAAGGGSSEHPSLVWCEAHTDPAHYAHDLYASLRRLDASGCDVIVVAAPPSTADWLAVNDRLRRAASGRK